MTATLRGIRAVTFDVGGTLIEPWPSVGHAYAEVASKFWIPGANPDALNLAFARAWKDRRDFDYSRPAWHELVRQTFAGLSITPPGDECFCAIYNHFAHAGAWRVFNDAHGALASARAQGLKVGLISNWDERLRPLLTELRLTGLFDVITISCEVGSTKPGGEIFGHCAARLGLAPEFILHVGDSRAEDVAGARGAGLKAVLLDRKAGRSDDEVVAGLDAVMELVAGDLSRSVAD
jgi:putative hydrolase of the HAD superfamily